jgi:ABC-2 type transport system ATP-binding protein
LFLDEPTAALDPEAAHMIREFIVELRKEGRTIFLTTHNLDEADRLCDRIGVFKSKLLVVDSPERLRTQLFGRKVVFHLSNPAETFAGPVGNLPFVQTAQPIDNKLLVQVDDPEQRNPHIIRELVEAGADIQFVGELRRSLEDVYLQLIKEA